jgi:hypothetical protein
METFPWPGTFSVAAESDASYRRGVHQTVGLAIDVVRQASTLQEANRQLKRLERLAAK